MFKKRINELNRSDIEQLVVEGMPEGAEIEFKETLPAKGGRDQWLDGSDRISERARNELIEEIIAFANAHGGVLVLGIAETTEKPARAGNVTPVPRCVDLAERLRLQCRDCIEPQIPMLEVVGIPLEESGSGVVIFKVQRSRMAPHRHTATKECYIRRADRTEKMTMREIQDLTLQVDRGLVALEKSFEQRRKHFSDAFKIFNEGKYPVFGVRASGIPLTPLRIDRVHNNPAVTPLLKRFSASSSTGIPFEIYLPISSVDWRPILRGSAGYHQRNNTMQSCEVGCDGLIEYSFLVQKRDENSPNLFIGWFMCLVANTLCAIERFRRAADAPEIEFGLELEIISAVSSLPVGMYFGSEDGLGPFPSGSCMFPRYSVGPPSEFQQLSVLIERDFLHAAGHDFNDPIAIDFMATLKALGL